MSETDAPCRSRHFPDGTLLEGIVTTLNADGSPHIAPMGPIVDADFKRLLLRPFRTSITYRESEADRRGRAARDRRCRTPRPCGRRSAGTVAATASRQRQCDGVILADACRWYAFRVESLDDRDERTTIVARVVDRGRLRDFFGFNRAKHAVVEAAILATRIGILDADTIAARIRPAGGRRSKKRAAHQERRAFAFPAAVRARGIATGGRNGGRETAR